MDVCKECGKKFSARKVADQILNRCGIYGPDFWGLCFNCAVIKYIDDTGNDPYEDDGEDDDDDEGQGTWDRDIAPYITDD